MKLSCPHVRFGDNVGMKLSCPHIRLGDKLRFEDKDGRQRVEQICAHVEHPLLRVLTYGRACAAQGFLNNLDISLILRWFCALVRLNPLTGKMK